MNINNWLCKTFDKDKKGYVVINDIIPALCLMGGIIIIIILLICGLLFIVSDKFTSDYPAPTSILDFIGVIGLVGWSLILIILVALVIEYILRIKIARCKLKEPEK